MEIIFFLFCWLPVDHKFGFSTTFPAVDKFSKIFKRFIFCSLFFLQIYSIVYYVQKIWNLFGVLSLHATSRTGLLSCFLYISLYIMGTYAISFYTIFNRQKILRLFQDNEKYEKFGVSSFTKINVVYVCIFSSLVISVADVFLMLHLTRQLNFDEYAFILFNSVFMHTMHVARMTFIGNTFSFHANALTRIRKQFLRKLFETKNRSARQSAVSSLYSNLLFVSKSQAKFQDTLSFPILINLITAILILIITSFIILMRVVPPAMLLPSISAAIFSVGQIGLLCECPDIVYKQVRST